MPEPAEQPKEPVRPRGKAVRWAGAQLDLLAEITPDDIEKAREEWQAVAPPQFKTLLDAHE